MFFEAVKYEHVLFDPHGMYIVDVKLSDSSKQLNVHIECTHYPHSPTLTVTVHLSDGKRRSIKMISDQTFNEGLFILDTNRIPWGCGVWPAFWTTKEATWPDDGEIDIIEEVHNAQYTTHTLHTSNGCDYRSVGTTGLSTGTWGTGREQNENRNCWVDEPTQWENQGCTLNAADGTHGESWTTGGGGVHVMLWDKISGTLSIFFDGESG